MKGNFIAQPNEDTTSIACGKETLKKYAFQVDGGGRCCYGNHRSVLMTKIE
jgi:hypothetical protein